MKDEFRFDMDKWKGQNLLGFALMKVRENLDVYYKDTETK